MINNHRSSMGLCWAWAGSVGLCIVLAFTPSLARANPCAEIEGKCWRVTHSLLTRSATTTDTLNTCRKDLAEAEHDLANIPEPPSDIWAGVAIGAGSAGILAVVLTLLAR